MTSAEYFEHIQVGSDAEGALLLSLFSAPLAAVIGVLAGLAIGSVTQSSSVIALSVGGAVAAVVLRSAMVTVASRDGRILVRNLLSSRVINPKNIQAVSAGSFFGAGRTLPVIVLLVDGKRIKLHATARVRKSSRKRFARMFEKLAHPDDRFDSYESF